MKNFKRAKQLVKGQKDFQSRRKDYQIPSVFEYLGGAIEEIERLERKLNKAEDVILDLSSNPHNVVARSYLEEEWNTD